MRRKLALLPSTVKQVLHASRQSNISNFSHTAMLLMIATATVSFFFFDTRQLGSNTSSIPSAQLGTITSHTPIFLVVDQKDHWPVRKLEYSLRPHSSPLRCCHHPENGRKQAAHPLAVSFQSQDSVQPHTFSLLPYLVWSASRSCLISFAASFNRSCAASFPRRSPFNTSSLWPPGDCQVLSAPLPLSNAKVLRRCTF